VFLVLFKGNNKGDGIPTGNEMTPDSFLSNNNNNNNN